MRTKFITTLLTAILLVTKVIVAQTPTTDTRPVVNRNSFWTETVINGVIKNKFKWQMDFYLQEALYPWLAFVLLLLW